MDIITIIDHTEGANGELVISSIHEEQIWNPCKMGVKKKLDMDMLIREAVKRNYRVGGYPMLEFWMDIGNKKNLDIIRNILKKK